MRRYICQFVLVCTVSLIFAGCATQTEQSSSRQSSSVEQLQEGLTEKHPAAYLQLAEDLFQRGQQDQAAVMFYVGQIRYRAYINTLTEAQAAAEEARYNELKTGIGDDINQYAARNLDNWIALLDAAVQWHKDNPSEFLPKDEYSLLYELTLYNFNKLREYIENNKDLIRSQRAQKGLTNE